ncbi:MAG: glycoside hydrolase family 104 protein [Chitinophagales bacterium]|nr:glycoside hydrolase family 104 protein [Chitinophagales bacterium]
MKTFSRLTIWQWIITVIVIVWIVTKVKRRIDTHNVKDSSMNQNMKAFLWMIRFAEGTATANGYRITYAYEKVLNDLSDHPYITGEWKGKTLPDAYCKGAGLKSGCKSTAAGAYQITVSTWRPLKKALGLPDFSPHSQDLAAIELIRQKGAIKDIESGNIEKAISKVRHIWASLPGNTSGQPQQKLAALKTIYKTAGGNLA